MKKTLLCITSLALGIYTAHAEDNEPTIETYSIDATHSSVKFSIRHFVAKTTGNFSDFEGTLEINRDDLTLSRVEATIEIPSIDTDSENRDAHLQEEDFFHSAIYPAITFTSTKWETTDSENHFKITGDLSFHGVTNSVTLDVELLGFGEGMGGAYLSGWEASTMIDRTDWGVDGGQPAVGSEVDIMINIEAVRQ